MHNETGYVLDVSSSCSRMPTCLASLRHVFIATLVETSVSRYGETSIGATATLAPTAAKGRRSSIASAFTDLYFTLFSPLICRAKCGSTLSRFVRLRFSLQPFHDPHQFGA